MNLRLLALGFFALLLPLSFLSNAATLTLNQKDFKEATIVKKSEGSLVRTQLTPEGKLKFKELNKTSVGQKVHAEIAGVSVNSVLRVPIENSGLEFGPFSPDEAARIITAINGQ